MLSLLSMDHGGLWSSACEEKKRTKDSTMKGDEDVEKKEKGSTK